MRGFLKRVDGSVATEMLLTFIHGGGDDAYTVDRELMLRICEAGGFNELQYPRVAGLERLEWEATFVELSEYFIRLDEPVSVIAHSVGGAAMLKWMLCSTCPTPKHLFLLAAPYKAEDSHWGKDDFTFDNDFAVRLPNDLSVSIYHSDDDAIIPFGDALLYAEKMPFARCVRLGGYGHQFNGSLEALAADIQRSLR